MNILSLLAALRSKPIIWDLGNWKFFRSIRN